MPEDITEPLKPFDWGAYSWLKEEHIEKLTTLAEEFRYWNARINLVSRKEIDLLEARHLLPCAAIIQMADLSQCKNLLDIGTGGGLPGLVLATLFPRLECTLLDATAKKLKAVEHMAGMLGLENVRVYHGRVEEHKARYDVVTGRGVTALPRFLSWASNSLTKSRAPAGLYYWKGGEIEGILQKRKLMPDEMFQLEDVLKDEHFKDKYILRYESRRLLNRSFVNLVN